MSSESFFQTESGKNEKEAYGKSYEERIKRKFCQRGDDSGNGTSRHGEHRPVRIEMARPENSKRERQKDASSPESHRKIIPEKYFCPLFMMAIRDARIMTARTVSFVRRKSFLSSVIFSRGERISWEIIVPIPSDSPRYFPVGKE